MLSGGAGTPGSPPPKNDKKAYAAWVKARDQRAFEAMQIHKQNAASMQQAKGGYSEVTPGEGISNTWQDKVGGLRQGIGMARERARERGKSFFRGR